MGGVPGPSVIVKRWQAIIVTQPAESPLSSKGLGQRPQRCANKQTPNNPTSRCFFEGQERVTGKGIKAELSDARTRNHCGEFACKSSQSRRFGANFANRANCRVNNLRCISGLRSSESPFLRHFIYLIINRLECSWPIHCGGIAT